MKEYFKHKGVRYMRIIKIISGVLILVAVFSAAVSATTTRDKGMGLDTNSWFIDGLQSYINENPSYLGDFKDRAFAERTSVTGVTEGQNLGGIFYSPTEGFTLGIYFGQPVNNTVWNTDDREGLFHKGNYSVKGNSGFTHSLSTTVLGAYQFEMLDNNIIDLMDPVDASATYGTATVSPTLREQLIQRNVNLAFSYDLGRLSLGLLGGYATSWNNKRNSVQAAAAVTNSDEYNLVNTEYSATFGFRFKINDKVDLDAAGQWVMYSLDNKYTQKMSGVSDTSLSYSSDGSMDIGGFARLGYKMTQAHKSHFYVGYSMLNRSTKGKFSYNNIATPANNIDATDSFKRTGQVIKVGVSDEITVNESTKAFLGFGVNYKTFTNDYSGKDNIDNANNPDTFKSDWTRIEIPLAVGLESKLTENWTGRFGLAQTIYRPFTDKGENITNSISTQTKSPTSINDNASSATTMNMGLTYKLSNFSFDWLASVDMFVTGPYAVSGKVYTDKEKTPMSTSFAATYTFGTTSSSDQGGAAAGQPARPR
jgi:hypothetical protein